MEILWSVATITYYSLKLIIETNIRIQRFCIKVIKQRNRYERFNQSCEIVKLSIVIKTKYLIEYFRIKSTFINNSFQWGNCDGKDINIQYLTYKG